MYQKLVPLRFSDHADYRFLPTNDYSFAKSELIAPIVIDEISDVAREYPIVFSKEGTLPVALLGVQQEANAYLSQNGGWRASYIPAHIRHYPLASMRLPKSAEPAPEGKVPQQAQKSAVLIDEESSMISRLEGDPIFDDDGSLNGLAREKASMLQWFDVRSMVTMRLLAAIREADILVERPIRIADDDGQSYVVNGLYMINEAALNALDKTSFQKLRTAGALPLVYASLISWANFRKGPIGQSHELQTLPQSTEDEGALA